MAEFVLKNNYFEFNVKVCRQISGTAIGTKFLLPYPYIFTDEMETNFLKIQQSQPFLWLRYIDYTFFIWTHGKEKLNLFLKDLNEFYPNLKFTYETSQNNIYFLDLNVSLEVQSCKSYNNKYMIALTQITNTEIFAFIAVLVLFINIKDNRNC